MTKWFFIGILLFNAWLLATASPDDSLTFLLNFENGLVPEIAKGDPTPTFLGEAEGVPCKYATALPLAGDGSGHGLVSGLNGQAVRFKAAGNINPEEGTVLFFVKGFPGEKWNLRDNIFHVFFFLIF